MGIFKLSFLTVGALGAAMMHFGRDENLPTDRLGLEPGVESASIEPVSAVVSAPVLVVPTRSETVTPKENTVIAPKAVAILPPAPDSQAGRAIAAAQAMANASDIVRVAATGDVAGTGAVGSPTHYVSASAVNMRAGPSTRNGIVGRLTRGTAVLVTGDTGTGWSQIRVVDSGKRGFMASKFLTASR